jgi:inner membrane protein
MLLFAHIGITLFTALTINRIFEPHTQRATEPTTAPAGATDSSSQNSPASAGLFDVRFWLIGGLLPDIIDKPIGHFLFNQSFGNNGRIFSHTLLFALVWLLAGLWYYRSTKKTSVLALSLGILVHLILDSMWDSPQTLFWPLFGWGFPTFQEYNWLESLLTGLTTSSTTYIPEIFGFLVTVWFAWRLLRNRKIVIFLRHGIYR